MIAFLVVMVLLIGYVLHLTPTWPRRDLFFAVTVSPQFRESDEASRILRHYRMVVWVATAIAVALHVAAPVSMAGLAPVLQSVAVIAAWAHYNRQVRPHAVQPPTIRSASLEPRDQRIPGGWAAVLGPFVILGIAALVLQLNWEQIPERFPVHWGAEGKPDRWATRNVGSVYFPFVPAICTLIMMTAVIFGIQYQTRRTAAPPEEAERQNMVRRGSILIGILASYFVVILMSYFALRPLISPGENLDLRYFLPLLFAGIAILLYASIRVGRSSARMSSSIQTVLGDQTDDACWKLGQFYYNPADPAILVERRFGIGYTLNFARWETWLLLVFALVPPLVMSVLL